MKLILLLGMAVVSSNALNNSAALTPPMGYSNWNAFHNKINSSLFLETATFMKKSGLLDAGYNYITLGGIGYANGSTWPNSQQGWGPDGPGNITRNASGFLQVDPIRFPGGNEGFRKMTDQIRDMGYKWGSYTEAGETGCNGAHGSSEGFEEQDKALFVDEWKSEYLMIDSCGVHPKPPPAGPPPGYPGGQARFEMTKWKNLLVDAQSKGAKPVVLHDCHNGCASNFAGPTLAVTACDANDKAQWWNMGSLTGNMSGLVDAERGFCAGCGSSPMDGCANDAARSQNGSGVGLGMQPCMVRCSMSDGATVEPWNYQGCRYSSKSANQQIK